jgi:succinate-acetate transporter protein
MSLCDNQDNFNDAFYKALKDSRKKDNKKMASGVGIYMLIHLIFLFWGIMLALKQPKDQQIVHLTLAIVFSPVYVLAYYLNAF